MKPKRYPYSGQKKKESNAIVKLALDSSKVADISSLESFRMRRRLFGQ